MIKTFQFAQYSIYGHVERISRKLLLPFCVMKIFQNWLTYFVLALFRGMNRHSEGEILIPTFP